MVRAFELCREVLREHRDVGRARRHVDLEVRRPRLLAEVQRGADIERDRLPNVHLVGICDRIPIGVGLCLQVVEVRPGSTHDHNLHVRVGVVPVDLLRVPVVPTLLHREDSRPLPLQVPRAVLLMLFVRVVAALFLKSGFYILAALRSQIVEAILELVGTVLEEDGVSPSCVHMKNIVGGPRISIKIQRVCTARLQLFIGRLRDGGSIPCRFGVCLDGLKRLIRRVVQRIHENLRGRVRVTARFRLCAGPRVMPGSKVERAGPLPRAAAAGEGGAEQPEGEPSCEHGRHCLPRVRARTGTGPGQSATESSSELEPESTS
mmetsp:Transcript_106172/g.277277  ORF Transcript_106172/g.277277 Transcript_106172/m.277277 type:complete len:319 (+) Transcript_106172:1118-2074(+)